MSVRVITDSTSNLSATDLERLRIVVVPMYVYVGDAMRPEPDVDPSSFFRGLAEGSSLPTSSQPTPDDLEQAFRAALGDGDDALGVFISARMSSTLGTAEMIASGIREARPGARIGLIDSQSNSMQEGFAVLAAARTAHEGGTLAECETAARESIRRSRFLFTPQSLDYLARGGRIAGAAAAVGSLLDVAPVLTAVDGATGVAALVRTHAKAMARIATLMRRDVERYGLKSVVVQSVADTDAGVRFGRELIDPIAGFPVPVIPVGPVVGLHVGPAVGVAYETIEPMR